MNKDRVVNGWVVIVVLLVLVIITGGIFIVLNYSGGGSVEVELLDEQLEPIEGYAKADSQPINGNSVRMPVRWRTTDDVSKLAGRPVRLRFHMQDCKLYAFQFRPRASETGN